MKVKKISNTCVSSIDTAKRKVRLEDSKILYHYKDDSMVLLLQKAMTKKATFIIKDGVISWVELMERVYARSR